MKFDRGVFAACHGTAGDKDNSDGIHTNVAEMFEQSSRSEYDMYLRGCPTCDTQTGIVNIS